MNLTKPNAGPQVGDRARYSGSAGTFVGRVTAVSPTQIAVRWVDASTTCVRPAGFRPAIDAETEWEVVR